MNQPLNNNLDRDYLAMLDESARADFKAKIDSIKSSPGYKPIVDQEPAIKPEDTDPTSLASSVFRGGLDVVSQAFVGGPIEAVQQSYDALRDLDGWISEKTGLDYTPADLYKFLGLNKTYIGEAVIAPAEALEGGEGKDILPPATTAGEITRDISQFITGFIPVLKASRAITGIKAGATAANFILTEGAAAFSGALALDPYEERLSNLIDKHTSLRDPVTQYLKAKPEDTAAEGRLKNALESLAIGPIAEGAFAAFRALKSLRRGQGFEGFGARNPNEASIAGKAFGDPNSKELAIRNTDLAEIPSSLNPDEPLPFQMNWANTMSGEDIEKSVRWVAKKFRNQFDDARRNTINDETLHQLADELGITPETFMKASRGGTFLAEEILAKKKILDQTTDRLIDLARKASTSTDTVDFYEFHKFLNFHAALQKHFQGAASETGRALRALQIPVGSKNAQILQIEHQLRQVGGPNKMRELAFAVSQVNDPTLVSKAVRESIGKRPSDMIAEWWYFALLSNPSTHVVNAVSNSMNLLWQIPERALAAQISALRGKPGVVEGEATQLVYGMVEGLNSGIVAAWKAMKTGEAPDVFQKIENQGALTPAITAENFGLAAREPGSVGWAAGKMIDGFGTMVRGPGRMLMSADTFYKEVAKAGELRAAAFAKASSEGLEGKALARRMDEMLRDPDEFLEGAEKFAQYVTFTRPLGSFGQKVQGLTSLHPTFKFVVPFTQTPINLLKWAGTRSPLALLNKNLVNQMRRGGREGDLAIARVMMGSGLMMVMADAALKGLVTGGGPTDPQLRETWLRSHRPYSIKMGDQWYSYSRGDPFGLLMGAAAGFAETFGTMTPDEREQYVTAFAAAISQNVMNKTWLQGPAETLEAWTNPTRFGEAWAGRMLGTFLVPAGVAQVTRNVDPVWRDAETIGQRIISRIPGYSDLVPPHRNLWGEKILFQGGLGPDIASPLYRFGVENDPIDEWMWENRVQPSLPQKSINGVELTSWEYDKYVTLAGKGAKEELDQFMMGTHPNQSIWNNATDNQFFVENPDIRGTRALIVEDVISKHREAAKIKIMLDSRDRVEFPELWERIELRAMQKKQSFQPQ